MFGNLKATLNWKGMATAHFKVLSKTLFKTKKNCQKTARIAGFHANIQIQYVLKAKQECFPPNNDIQLRETESLRN
jgi:hypothetical protein